MGNIKQVCNQPFSEMLGLGMLGKKRKLGVFITERTFLVLHRKWLLLMESKEYISYLTIYSQSLSRREEVQIGVFINTISKALCDLTLQMTCISFRESVGYIIPCLKLYSPCMSRSKEV